MAEVAPPYGGEPMEFSTITIIEMLKLVEAIIKLVVKLVKAIKKRRKKPP